MWTAAVAELMQIKCIKDWLAVATPITYQQLSITLQLHEARASRLHAAVPSAVLGASVPPESHTATYPPPLSSLCNLRLMRQSQTMFLQYRYHDNIGKTSVSSRAAHAIWKSKGEHGMSYCQPAYDHLHGIGEL